MCQNDTKSPRGSYLTYQLLPIYVNKLNRLTMNKIHNKIAWHDEVQTWLGQFLMSHVKIIQVAQIDRFSFMNILRVFVTIMCDLNFDFIMSESFSNCQVPFYQPHNSYMLCAHTSESCYCHFLDSLFCLL